MQVNFSVSETYRCKSHVSKQKHTGNKIIFKSLMKMLNRAHILNKYPLKMLDKSLSARALYNKSTMPNNSQVSPGFTVHNVGSHKKIREKKKNQRSLGVTLSPDLWGRRDTQAGRHLPGSLRVGMTAAELQNTAHWRCRDWRANFGGRSQGLKIQFHTQASHLASSCTNEDSKYSPNSQQLA